MNEPIIIDRDRLRSRRRDHLADWRVTRQAAALSSAQRPLGLACFGLDEHDIAAIAAAEG